MIAVIFEVEPKPSHTEQYFEKAESLKPLLEKVDGFISIERFQSVKDSGRYLSLSFWRDEQAVKVWRHELSHREAQKAGIHEIFQDYRLRVALVIRDYGIHDRAQAPPDNGL